MEKAFTGPSGGLKIHTTVWSGSVTIHERDSVTGGERKEIVKETEKRKSHKSSSLGQPLWFKPDGRLQFIKHFIAE